MPALGCFQSLCVEALWAGWARSVCIVGISKQSPLNKAFRGGEETRAPVNICKTNCREIIAHVVTCVGRPLYGPKMENEELIQFGRAHRIYCWYIQIKHNGSGGVWSKCYGRMSRAKT